MTTRATYIVAVEVHLHEGPGVHVLRLRDLHVRPVDTHSSSLELAIVHGLDCSIGSGFTGEFDEAVQQTVAMAAALDLHRKNRSKRAEDLMKILLRCE